MQVPDKFNCTNSIIFLENACFLRIQSKLLLEKIVLKKDNY